MALGIAHGEFAAAIALVAQRQEDLEAGGDGAGMAGVGIVDDDEEAPVTPPAAPGWRMYLPKGVSATGPIINPPCPKPNSAWTTWPASSRRRRRGEAEDVDQKAGAAVQSL